MITLTPEAVVDKIQNTKKAIQELDRKLRGSETTWRAERRRASNAAQAMTRKEVTQELMPYLDGGDPITLDLITEIGDRFNVDPNYVQVLSDGDGDFTVISKGKESLEVFLKRRAEFLESEYKAADTRKENRLLVWNQQKKVHQEILEELQGMAQEAVTAKAALNKAQSLLTPAELKSLGLAAPDPWGVHEK